MVENRGFDFAVPAEPICTPLGCEVSPTAALRALRGQDRPFALTGTWADGVAVLGSAPVVVVEGPDTIEALGRHPVIRPGRDRPVLGGGWFGYLGFGLAHELETLDPSPPVRVPLPAGAVAFYDHLLRCDRDGRWWFEALLTPGRAEELRRRQETLAAALAAPPPSQPFATSGWRWQPGLAGHGALVDACRTRIAAGDLFQANLALRLEGQLLGDPLDLFAAASERLHSERAAYLAGPWGAIASLSPELFLERSARQIRTAPIKGTRPLARAGELVGSAKDRAENVMIVDLMRNDLGRICVPGTIRVPMLVQVRPQAGVAHLVSEVEGRLRDDVTDHALLRATFPPGSVTGAPKIAALGVISELESTRREVYTGAIGFSSPLDRLELSVAIRTFETRGRDIWLGTGGGITSGSDANEETAEAAAKAAPLLGAIGAVLPRLEDDRGPAPRFRRRGPRPTPRPDPAAGIYETVHVVRGVPRRWAVHRARLSASLQSLYGFDVVEDLDRRIELLVRDADDARLRIDVVPGEAVRLDLTAMPPRSPVQLRPVLLPGGLGPHKWRDRRLLEAFEQDDPRSMPLLVDVDGHVLETSRTAVVVRSADGQLWTPPNDGRILPSTTAAAHRARPRLLTLTDLRQAPAIYVASALRGLQPATLLERDVGSES